MKRKSIFIILIILISGLAIYYFIPGTKLDTSQKIDKVVVYKSKKTMEVYAKNTLLKTYSISLGGNPKGHKQFEGDQKTPEGKYYVYFPPKNFKSNFYKSLYIDYPNAKDKQYAQKQKKSPGGNICIHGLPNKLGFIGKFHRFYNWTDGCIAVTNDEMDELYNIKNGTQIIIHP